MKIYELYESVNGKAEWKKGIYLTMECINEFHHTPKSSHLTENGWIEDEYTYRINEVEYDNPIEFHVYKLSSKNYYSDGKRYSGFETFEDAMKFYNKLTKSYYAEIQLPQKQFGGIGITKVKTNVDENYWKMRKAYWEQQEIELDEY